MKTYIPYSLILAAASVGIAYGAETAYTTPVGYTTQALAANTFNLVGLTVLKQPQVAGKLTNVSGPTLSDSTVNFSTLLVAGRTYTLEITSGLAIGTVQEFVIWTGSTMTLPAVVAGISINDSYVVRVAPTIEETFITSPASITASFTSAGADIIWIPNGLGAYDKYFLSLPGPIVKTLAGANAPNVPVVYVDGVFVQKKGTASSFVASGEVKRSGSNALVVGGATVPVSIVAPTGLTLVTCGLADDLTSSFTAAGADIVWVPQPGGAYSKYGLRLPGPTWQKLTISGAFDGTTLVDFALPSSVLIQRKGASKVVSLNVPASFSNF